MIRKIKENKQTMFLIKNGIVGILVFMIILLGITIAKVEKENKQLHEETNIKMFDKVELYAKELELEERKKEILDGLTYKESVSFSAGKIDLMETKTVHTIQEIDKKIKLYREMRIGEQEEPIEKQKEEIKEDPAVF